MSYSTLMVHLTLGTSNAALLRIAADLARKFDASLIGIAACQPMPMVYGDGYMPAEIFEQDRGIIGKDMKAAEAEFRSAFESATRPLAWRTAVTTAGLADFLAREARSADLIITGVSSDGPADSARAVNTSDLIMQAGRPVLVVPVSTETLQLERVLVGWKDSRETRRAIGDALPLLKKAAHVTVAQIAAEQDMDAARAHVEDVVGWLKRHGIAAQATTMPSTGDDATGLHNVAQDLGADLIVAGAYGHSRLREWALGGVTRDFLLHADRCSLLSH